MHRFGNVVEMSGSGGGVEVENVAIIGQLDVDLSHMVCVCRCGVGGVKRKKQDKIQTFLTRQLFELQNGSGNMGHRFEKPGIDDLDRMKRDMRKFLNGK